MKSLQIVGNARYGGATYLMLEWSKYLVQKGYQVDIVCTDEVMVQKSKEIPGVNVIDSIYMPREIKPGVDLKAFIQLLKLMRKEQYHVVHTYTAVPSFLGRFAGTLTRRPVVVNHQGGWSVGEQSSFIERLFFTPLEYVSNLACTKNICVSHAEKAKALEYRLGPERKLVTIVNGLNTQPFVEAHQERNREEFLSSLGVPTDHFVLGNTGRLVAGKGNETLIEAIHLLNKHRKEDEPYYTLVLAGDGVDRPQLEQLIRDLNVEQYVKLLGFWSEIPKFLANIDVFITPSLTEGLSISLLEAMASKCAIVSTDIPPNAEVVLDEQCGILVPINAPEAIREAVVRYVREDGLAETYSANAQERALSYYNLGRMFDETWDLYVDLLHDKGYSQEYYVGAST